MFRIDAEPLYARILVFCGWLKRNGSPLPRRPGPVVKWYYAAFALLSQEFDSPQVHKSRKRLSKASFFIDIESKKVYNYFLNFKNHRVFAIAESGYI